MNEEDKYENPTERRNLRFKYRELIADTERRFEFRYPRICFTFCYVMNINCIHANRAVNRGGIVGGGGATPPQDWPISHIRKIGNPFGNIKNLR